MISFGVYGKEGTKSGVGLSYKVPAGKDFIWMFVERPSDEEITRITKDFSIPKKYFSTYFKEHRSRRYSIDPLIFVYADYFVEGRRDEKRSTPKASKHIDHGSHIKAMHVMMILTKNALIITVPQLSKFHTELFNSLSDTLEKGKNKSLSMLMYQFLLDDASENYDVLEEVHEKIVVLEENVLKAKNGNLLKEIVKIKRAIHRMSRRFWGTARIISLIKKGLTPLEVDKETMSLLDDVYDTYMHQIDILRAYRDLITDALTLYTTNISNKLATASNNLNVIVKRLTAITVILMVPTLIAGVYGMNFDIPEFHFGPMGYYMALAVMVISIAAVMFYFKAKDWL
ncbi:MAG: hypothetical protein HY513_04645 [Candidatus Aenigmarchaeota archaeon]|nr:hypothetical protein [Candidatus Aenigmarchaeota archaeon]